MEETKRVSQMGLHFDPSHQGGYHVTMSYWDELEEVYDDTANQTVKFLIEAGYHFLGEVEHHSGWRESPSEAFEIITLRNQVLEFVTETIRSHQFVTDTTKELLS